ncbi:hypothetical protein AMATHDRAFT_71858 [Amanita thiersii Skay4041]|uniref:Ubiquitin-like domain-containing protein n=1 Tax=Amanita thiersii Skay4041 TaxID=703135 RepID=A0A2A9NCE3_9AGAR|nr:hypothetical protein AMATHDRAFT_71858 [Amanita thiersii Skay4041]
MAEQAEQTFAAAFLNTLSTQPVTFKDDYQQPLHLSLKRVPVLQIPLPLPPPTRRKLDTSDGSTSTAAINIVFKSIKPAASYSLSVQPTDTISSIKAQLSRTHASAPAPDAQRLLLKGKALADNKLLKEYNIKEGDTVTLVVKPGVDWDPNAMNTNNTDKTSAARLSPSPSMSGFASSSSSLAVHATEGSGTGGPAKTRGKHQRIPSVVLSPSPSTSDLRAASEGSAGNGGDTSTGANSAPPPEKDILLTLDSTDVPAPIQPEILLSSYHNTVADPMYWERLYSFLKSEFPAESDAIHAFEEYLRATKGALTASEIAKIRDHTGIVGMAGT